MLFNSYEFLLVFLPVSLAIYLLFGHTAVLRAAILAAISLIFYANWDWRFLALLLSSIAMNYGIGLLLHRAMCSDDHRGSSTFHVDVLAAFGITLNLLLLGVFKYASFAVENLDALAGISLVIPHIILPLGISFFTFEQLGFLIDLRRGQAYRLDPLRYVVFVAFFPRLVAGPILRYGEIEPQLERKSAVWDNSCTNLAIGLSIFAVGLVKKAVLADGISPFVAAPFAAASIDEHLDLFMAWGGTLAYTCQLYFDFSGYSDMAIGAARCFGIRLPQNFASPYKSASIIEFWRCWHITLSRFLRDYLYIPLGGSRCGYVRRYTNLIITMTLGGLWHGANWTFLVWGLLHGTYLAINHIWNAAAARIRLFTAFRTCLAGRAFGRTLTFLAVVVAWVFFRATSFHAAFAVLGAMTGQQGAELPAAIVWYLQPLAPLLAVISIHTGGGSGSQFTCTWLWVASLLTIAFLAPNTQEIFARAHPTLEHRPHPLRLLRWSASPAWAVAIGFAAFLGFLAITRASAFLYWQF